MKPRHYVILNLFFFAFLTAVMCALPIHRDGQVNPLVIHYGAAK